MLLDGIFIPLTTPFMRDGRLYTRKLEHNVDRYSKTPAAGLIALSANGEASALSDEETLEVLRVVAGVAAKEKVLIAGVSRDSVRLSLALAEAAAAEGFDAVLAHAPAGGRYAAAETLLYFRALADASALPVILSSGSGVTALHEDWVAELARHPNIIGLIDADISVARYKTLVESTAEVVREVVVTNVFAAVTARMQSAVHQESGMFVSAESLGSGAAAVAVAPPTVALKTRPKKVGFQILPAGSVDMLPLLLAGGAGAVPALAACAPQACHEVYAAWKDGDPALAAEKAERISSAAVTLNDELGVAGLKYGCDLNGYYGGAPRLPGLALDAKARLKVEEALKEIRN